MKSLSFSKHSMGSLTKTSLLIVGLLFLPFTTALGCPNCLGYDKGALVSSCHKACGDPAIGFKKKNEIEVCREYCDKMVKEKSCCTSTCSANRYTCTRPASLSARDTLSDTTAIEELEEIKKDPSKLNMVKLIARDPPYHMLRTTRELRSLNPHFLGTWHLEASTEGGFVERDGATKCCKMAKTMAQGSKAMVPHMFGSEDDFFAMVSVMCIAMAAASTCGHL